MRREGRSRFFGRSLLLGCAALALLTSASPVAAAVPPGGSFPGAPRLAAVELIDSEHRDREGDPVSSMALSTFGETGGALERLLTGPLEGAGITPSPFQAPAWSPDGQRIVFAGSKGKRRALFLVGVDGRGLHRLAGTAGGTEPVFAPDNRTIAFARSRFHLPKPTLHGFRGGGYLSTTIWLLDTQTGKSRRLTRWRNGLENEPGSFSPDGSLLAVTKRDDALDAPVVMLMRTDGSGAVKLAQPAEEPRFSPDGTRIAMVGYYDAVRIEAEEDQDYDIGDLYTVGVDGNGLTRVTRNETGIESAPSWDASGQRLAYVQAKPDTSFDPVLGLLFPTGNAIREVNADGTCAKTIRSAPRVALYGAAWQPGFGHGAVAPIAC